LAQTFDTAGALLEGFKIQQLPAAIAVATYGIAKNIG